MSAQPCMLDPTTRSVSGILRTVAIVPLALTLHELAHILRSRPLLEHLLEQAE
jgi:hypothetical protein